MNKYFLIRAGLWPFGFILAHTTIIVWKVVDPNQIEWARLIVKWLYEPIIHPAVVWLVVSILKLLGNFGSSAVSGFQTYLRNNPPTHHDADKILYSVLTIFFIWLLYRIGAAIRRFFTWNESDVPPGPRPYRL